MKNFLPGPIVRAFILMMMSATVYAQEKPGPLLGNYPNRPLRVLSSTVTGGAGDVTARAVAEKLGERIGQAVLVENRPGANGVIAMDTMVNSVPDGYTLLSSGNLVILNGVTKKVPYDVRKTFDVAVQMTSQPYFLVVMPSLNINTAKELIAYAKSHPGTLNYGSSGIGGVNHLAFELFQAAAGISLVHVPYKSNAQAFPDFVTGRLQLLFVGGSSSAPLIRSGKMKAIGVASTRRMSAFADVPTISDSGMPGFEFSNSFYLYLPVGVPQSVQTALNRAVNQIVNTPVMKERFAADATEPGSAASPANLKKAFLAEYEMWDELIR